MAGENKNLATCKPIEFLSQTVRIRKAVEGWLSKTKILEIRKKKVEGLKTFPPNATAEEKAEVIKYNAELVSAQRWRNVSEIFDNVAEKYPNETLELLALACFVEPENVNDHEMAYYLRNFSELISNKDVLNFFVSLMQLEQTATLTR